MKRCYWYLVRHSITCLIALIIFCPSFSQTVVDQKMVTYPDAGRLKKITLYMCPDSSTYSLMSGGDVDCGNGAYQMTSSTPFEAFIHSVERIARDNKLLDED